MAVTGALPIGTLVTALIFFAGCAAPRTDPSIAELQAIGFEKFGHRNVSVAIIPSSKGSINAALVSGLNAALGPSRLVRHTAANLKEAHARRTDVLFYSPTPAWMGKVIVQSLGLLPTNSLSGMRIHAIDVDPAQIEIFISRSGAELVK